ncbi:MAG: hypothetical protein GY861_25115 [bacterium]|nr:hypothetical protein [bacterium]
METYYYKLSNELWKVVFSDDFMIEERCLSDEVYDPYVYTNDEWMRTFSIDDKEDIEIMPECEALLEFI